MQKSIPHSLLFLLLALFGCQSGGKAQAPDSVKATFESKYPGENDPNWHKDKNGNFESNFKADFTPDGKWIETERSNKKKELPETI